jgi:hypothetical protein
MIIENPFCFYRRKLLSKKNPIWDFMNVPSDILRTHQFLNDLRVVADIKRYIDNMRNTRLAYPQH